MYDLPATTDAVGAHAQGRPNSVWRMGGRSTPELSKQAGLRHSDVQRVIYGSRLPGSCARSRCSCRRRSFAWPLLHGRRSSYVDQRIRLCRRETTGYKGGNFAHRRTRTSCMGKLPDARHKRIDSPTPWVLDDSAARAYSIRRQVDARGRQEMCDGRDQGQFGLSEFMGGPAMPAPKYDIRPRRPPIRTCRSARSTSRIRCSSGSCSAWR